MNDNPKPDYVIPGLDKHDDGTPANIFMDGQRAYWFVKCPACGKVHERIVHQHWDDKLGVPGRVESHQVVCMTTQTTFFISGYYPFEVLREVHFGLTKDPAAHSSDEPVPF